MLQTVCHHMCILKLCVYWSEVKVAQSCPTLCDIGMGCHFFLQYVIKEIQIKTMRYHYVPIRMVKIQNTDSTKCWWGFKATGALIHHWWECKIIQTFWKTVWCLLIKLNIHLLYDPINRVSWCLPKGVENLCSYKNLHVDIFSRFIINCQNLEATVFH